MVMSVADPGTLSPTATAPLGRKKRHKRNRWRSNAAATTWWAVFYTGSRITVEELRGDNPKLATATVKLGQHALAMAFLEDLRAFGLKKLHQLTGTLRDWSMWISQLAYNISESNLHEASSLLAQCLEDDMSQVDTWCQRRMFTDPSLTGHHAELWRLMQPQITPELRKWVHDQLKVEFGWGI